MLTNVYEYNEINRLTFSHNVSEIVSPLAKTACLAIGRIFFCYKVHFSIKCLDLKARSEKWCKTECFVHHFRTGFS